MQGVQARRARIAAALLAIAIVVGGSPTASAEGAAAWAWGWNAYGQLGDGTVSPRLAPVAIAGVPEVRQVAAGGLHSIALAADGTVWTWGHNNYGELGIGLSGPGTDRWTPGPVLGLADIVMVSAGDEHCMALQVNGDVWAWGSNGNGQVGDGTTGLRSSPVKVSGLTDVVRISAGLQHSLALRRDGTVWAWGYNDGGRLGDGTEVARHVPVQVVGISGVCDIGAGGAFSAALRPDGTVWTWGENQFGQLGDGSCVGRLTPGQVIGIGDAVAIGAGGAHCLALRSDSTVWAWGFNAGGRLGDGTESDRSLPVRVHDLTGVVAISAGISHSMAVASDGTAYAWGSNPNGQLGDGTTTDRFTPVPISALSGVGCIAGGVCHSFALTGTPRTGSSVWVPGRTGVITDGMDLRAYVRREADNAWLSGRAVAFAVDGVHVGTAITGFTGRASFPWVVSEGPASRTILAAFAGDPLYSASSGSATLTARTVTTKMSTYDRAGRITEYITLRALLLRTDNTPVAGKPVTFYVDGTAVGTVVTNPNGRALIGCTIADGPGAGSRVILVDWPGDGGYRASSAASTLYVGRALPYVWVLPKSVPLGGLANLYAYFRRLDDLQKQSGKDVVFSVDGTPVGAVTTDASAVARCLYRTTEAVGEHSIRCEFAGDAWLDAGYGEATLTIY